MKNVILVLILFVSHLSFASWQIDSRKESRSGERRVMLYASSENNFGGRNTAMLAVVGRCSGSKGLLILAHPKNIEGTSAFIRLDQRLPVEVEIERFPTDDKTVYLGHWMPDELMDLMKKSSMITVRYEEVGGKRVDAIFSLRDFATQTRKVVGACLPDQND